MSLNRPQKRPLFPDDATIQNVDKKALSQTTITFQDLYFIQAATTVMRGPGNLQPYILCNEALQARTLDKLKAKTQASGESNTRPTLHLGFSVWFNLDLIAMTHPDYAIILDIDPGVNIVYQRLQATLIATASRVEFIQDFLDKVDADDLLRFPRDYVEQLLIRQLTDPNGFLSSESSFQAVRKMCQQGRVFFGLADLTCVEQMSALKKWCQDKNLKIDTVYLSNIPEWILEYESLDRQNALINNITTLIEEDTCVIDAFYPTSRKNGEGPPQRSIVGTIPSFKKQKAIARMQELYTPVAATIGVSQENNQQTSLLPQPI